MQECEVKFCVDDFADLRQRLQKMGARREGLFFEENTLFDTNPSTLRPKKILLRLRKVVQKKGIDYLLTLKEPPLEHKTCKIREEHELSLRDGETLLRILALLGYERSGSYEKMREVWKTDACTFCLDEVFFGKYVEIEGSEDAIEREAGKLGLLRCPRSTFSYSTLFEQWCQKNGYSPAEKDFAFSEEERVLLLERLQKEDYY